MGRPRGPGRDAILREAVKLARLEGESEGRMLGRNEERRKIAGWLRFQKGTPEELSRRINLGEHMSYES